MPTIEVIAHRRTTVEAARHALGPTCRHHDPPRPVQVGEAWAMYCPSCGRIVSTRDALGMRYPKHTGRLRAEARQKLIDAVDAQGRQPRLSSTNPRVTAEQVLRAMRMGGTQKRTADILGVNTSSLRKMLRNRGIPRPPEWS